jgi:hypothetical protein
MINGSGFVFIEVDESCWISVLDRLGGTDYFEFLTKNLK